MTIEERIKSIKNEIGDKVKLVAVTKTYPPEIIKVAYDSGHKIFGENKAQELIAKYPNLPGDIEWHFIGHLQTNKVKYVVPIVSLIHSVDSYKLMNEINKEAQKRQKVVNCLLQFHIASEETKFGFNLDEVKKILDSEEFYNLKNIKICGVMGMATFTSDENQIRKEFKNLVAIYYELKNKYFVNNDEFKEISMGMSEDYKIAVEEGSTIVRIGSAIFGKRNY